MKVVVGGIIHDRPGIPGLLEAYLAHVARLRTDDLNVRYVWVVDADGQDLALAIRWAIPEAHLVHVQEPLPGSRYERGASGNHSSYARLAVLRNTLAQEALRFGAEALLSIDSDILVPANLTLLLRDAGWPWVAALVRNRPDFLHLGTYPSDSIEDRWWNVLWFPRQEGRPVFQHFKAIGIGPDETTWPRGAAIADQQEPFHNRLGTGAVCWYQRDLLERFKWETKVPSPGDPTGEQCRGEDVGFSIHALNAGVSAAYVPTICDHIMDSATMERHRQQCPTCVLRT